MGCKREHSKRPGTRKPFLLHVPFAQLLHFFFFNIFYYSVNYSSFVRQRDSPPLWYFWYCLYFLDPTLDYFLIHKLLQLTFFLGLNFSLHSFSSWLCSSSSSFSFWVSCSTSRWHFSFLKQDKDNPYVKLIQIRQLNICTVTYVVLILFN